MRSVCAQIVHTIGAAAHVRVDVVHARSAIEARRTGAFINVDLALTTSPTWRMRKHVWEKLKATISDHLQLNPRQRHADTQPKCDTAAFLPGRHKQAYEAYSFTHDASLKQGELAHSSISVSQWTPNQPGQQDHHEHSAPVVGLCMCSWYPQYSGRSRSRYHPRRT
jgi:hypothetical protein